MGVTIFKGTSRGKAYLEHATFLIGEALKWSRRGEVSFANWWGEAAAKNLERGRQYEMRARSKVNSEEVRGGRQETRG